ncbi:MAG: response regulator, partial [Micromonosporaceae bacterium]|nr:response regulator [Micromonosporaceae bacterium]
YPGQDHVIRVAPVACDCGTRRHLVSTQQRPEVFQPGQEGQSDREARAIAAAKSEFLALLGHEIRTPVTGVVGMVDLLRSLPLDHKVREVVDGVYRSTQILKCMIDDLLDLARLETGSLELDHRPCSVRGLLESVAEPMQEQVRSKGILLLAATDPETPTTVITDPARLRQVLTSLVSNAVKFTDRGEVVITAEQIADDRLLITVVDTGSGLSSRDQERVLAPFVQGDSSVSRAHEGAGLGLAIAARLVARMGGTIAIDSEPGRGSEFRVLLPVTIADTVEPVTALVPGADRIAVVAPSGNSTRALSWIIMAAGGTAIPCDLATVTAKPPEADAVLWCDNARSPEAAERAEQIIDALGETGRAILLSTTDPRGGGVVQGAALITAPITLRRLVALLNSERSGVRGAPIPIRPISGGRILLAEDNEVNRDIFRRMIELLGLECDTAADGEAAVRLATGKRPYDIILMDVQMPHIDGLTATRQIRRAGVRTPILALSATALPGDEERCTAAGMDAYLPKPITIPELREALAAYLEAPGSATYHTPETPAHPRVVPERIDLGTLHGLEAELADRPLVVSTVSAFLAQLDGRRTALSQALERHDRETLRTTAHTLKSASALLGAQSLADACATIEQRANLAPERELLALVEDIERASINAEMTMAAYLAEKNAPDDGQAAGKPAAGG